MQPSQPPENPPGQPTPPPPPPPPGGAPVPGGQQPNNGVGIASMVLGIVSIPFCACFGIGGLAGIVAIVLGFNGKAKAERGEATNRGVALAGIITGFVGVGLAIIYWILFALGTAIDFTEFGQ